MQHFCTRCGERTEVDDESSDRTELEAVNNFVRSLGYGQGQIDTNGLVACLEQHFAMIQVDLDKRKQ